MLQFFPVFIVSIDYSGDISSLLKLEANETVNIINCRFMNLGNKLTHSALYVYNGVESVKVNECFFFNCTANQGGAMSFTGPYNLSISKVCSSNNTANAGGGDIFINVSSPYSMEYISASFSTCERSNIYLKQEFNLRNFNASYHLNRFERKIEIPYGLGNLYVNSDNKPFNYSYGIFTNCTSDCGIVYHEYCYVDYYVHHCMFYENTITRYAIFYSYSCKQAICHVSDVSIIGNNMDGYAYFRGQSATISLDNNVYIDGSYLWDYVTTKGLVSNTNAPMEIYPMYQTAYCYAILEPTIEPQPIPTPNATIPLNTPSSTQSKKPETTPSNTNEGIPTNTPIAVPSATPNDVTQSPNPHPFPSSSPQRSFEPTATDSGREDQGGDDASKKKNETRNLIIIIAGSVLVFLVILVAVIYLVKKNSQEDKSSETESSVEMETAIMTTEMGLGVTHDNIYCIQHLSTRKISTHSRMTSKKRLLLTSLTSNLCLF